MRGYNLYQHVQYIANSQWLKQTRDFQEGKEAYQTKVEKDKRALKKPL